MIVALSIVDGQDGNNFTLECEMNGAELALKILSHSKGGIEKLIVAAKGSECDWLEFKAGLNPPKSLENPQKEDKFNKFDAYWHVARAIVAMQNSHGGVVLIGIDDTGQAVGLTPSDTNNKLQQSEDCFARECLDPALRPKSLEWKGTKKRYHITQDEYTRLFEYKFVNYTNKTIVAVIVYPAYTANVERILVQERLVQDSDAEREVLLHRQQGENGKVVTLWQFNEIMNYPCQISKSDYFDLLYESFIDSVEINFLDAMESTQEKLYTSTPPVIVRCIGIDLQHFWEGIRPIIKGCSSFLNYPLEVQLYLIDPVAEENDNDSSISRWRNNSQHSLASLQTEIGMFANKFTENGGQLILKVGKYSKIPAVHGWCVENASKQIHYYISEFSQTEDGSDWNPRGYKEITIDGNKAIDDERATQFEGEWHRLVRQHELTEETTK